MKALTFQQSTLSSIASLSRQWEERKEGRIEEDERKRGETRLYRYHLNSEITAK